MLCSTTDFRCALLPTDTCKQLLTEGTSSTSWRRKHHLQAVLTIEYDCVWQV